MTKNKNEFKYVLSFEKSDKNYGNGESIHVTVRGDAFQTAYDELCGEVMTKMVSLIGQGEKIKQGLNKWLELKTFTGEIVRYNHTLHKYTDKDGNELVSGSQYAQTIKPEFNKAKIVPATAKKLGIDAEDLDDMWSNNGKISRTLGDAIHYSMEQWFKHKDHGTEKDYHLPKHPFLNKVVTSFPDKDKDVLPEVIISDVKNRMVGRVDGLQGSRIIDYKSDANVEKNLSCHFKQLSFYATILNNKGHKINKIVVWNYTNKWTKYEDKPLTIKLKP